MNKYTNINEIEDAQLKELNLNHNFIYAFRTLKMTLQGKQNYGVGRKEYIEGKDFFELTEQDLLNAHIRNLGEIGAKKVIWLQQYLKGEVSGVFKREEKTEDEKMLPLKNHIKILEERIEKLKEENESLKEEISKLKKEQKKVQSVKNKILQIAKGIDE